MEQYKLPSHINPDKVFIVNRSELEGRIDPEQYHSERIVAIEKLKKNNTLKKLRETVFNVKTIISDIHETDIYVGLENIVSDTGEYLPTKEKTQISSAGVFKKGQILFPKLRPYLNKVYLTEFDGICSTEFHIFDGKGIDNTALAIYLRSNLIVAQTKHLMTGNTLPRLQTEDINNLPIPNRLYEYQQQIVDLYQEAYNKKQQKEAEAKALLDGIDDYLLGELGIALPEKDNSLQNRIFTAQFSEIGGGRLDPLSLKNNISDFLTGKYGSEKMKNIILSFKSGFGAGKQDQVLDDSGIIQIRPTNIDEQGTLKFDKNVYLPIDVSYSESDYINVDDILFNNTNSQEWVGKTAILKEKQLLLYSNHITKITVNKDVVVPDYIWLILNSYQKNKIFYSICTNWNNQSGVGLDLLRSLPIPLPPLEKQNEIARYIQSIREQAKQLQNDAKAILEQAKQDVELMILG